MHERVLQRSQLLFAQFDFIGDLARVHNEFRFHVDEVVEICILIGAEAFQQDVSDVRSTPIDVVFQAFSFGQLLHKSVTFCFQNFLVFRGWERERVRKSSVKTFLSWSASAQFEPFSAGDLTLSGLALSPIMCSEFSVRANRPDNESKSFVMYPTSSTYDRYFVESAGRTFWATLKVTSCPRASFAALSSVSIVCSVSRTFNFLLSRSTSSSCEEKMSWNMVSYLG